MPYAATGIVLMEQAQRSRWRLPAVRREPTASTANNNTAAKVYSPRRLHSLPSSERNGSTDSQVEIPKDASWRPRQMMYKRPRLVFHKVVTLSFRIRQGASKTTTPSNSGTTFGVISK